MSAEQVSRASKSCSTSNYSHQSPNTERRGGTRDQFLGRNPPETFRTTLGVQVPARGVLVVAAVPRNTRWGPLTIISAVRVRQQPLTHWSMPTHAASLSPFLVPLTLLSHPTPHCFRVSLWLEAFLSLSRLSFRPSFSGWSVGPPSLFLSPAPPLLFIALSPTGPRNPLPPSLFLTALFPPGRPFCGVARVRLAVRGRDASIDLSNAIHRPGVSFFLGLAVTATAASRRNSQVRRGS